ncbi:TonB-dependent receptor plug domain-containing protein [Thiothrix subterranea]|uniref:TonB-dependent receptor plug domain-containing protein n=1 Tax=Thiothrix subterranea TaxID=2735563 RepID=UPI00280A5762|nr:TonB-dependent receptor plug domain-containing protein [Thiothrix subterranea]
MQPTLTRLTLLSSLLILSAAVCAEDTLVVDIKSTKKAPSPNEVQPLAAERSAVLPADGGDFLKQLNGVSGSRFGGRGIEPIIRGQSQTQLNVLLDGAYVHGGCPNRMDPPASWAALETYESVKVEKGVQTLQHGFGGSGGAVLFERDTRSILDPEDGWSGKASATTMSNGVKHDVSADVTKAFQQGYARVFTQDREADNYEDGDGKEVRASYTHKQAGVVLGLTQRKTVCLNTATKTTIFLMHFTPVRAWIAPKNPARSNASNTKTSWTAKSIPLKPTFTAAILTI